VPSSLCHADKKFQTVQHSAIMQNFENSPQKSYNNEQKRQLNTLMMFNANLFLNQAVEWTGSNVLLSCQ